MGEPQPSVTVQVSSEHLWRLDSCPQEALGVRATSDKKCVPPYGRCSPRKGTEDKESQHSLRQSEENQQSGWFSSQGLRETQFSSQEPRARDQW